jgi:hypothetical protein
MAEHEKREVIVLEHVGFTGACAMLIPANEIYLDELRLRGEPDRGLLLGTRQPSYLKEPRLDRGMPMNRNRNVDVLGYDEAGPCVGFEQIRDFGTHYQDSGFLENWRNSAKREQKTCPEVHSCFGVYAPLARGATGSDHVAAGQAEVRSRGHHVDVTAEYLR